VIFSNFWQCGWVLQVFWLYEMGKGVLWTGANGLECFPREMRMNMGKNENKLPLNWTRNVMKLRYTCNWLRIQENLQKCYAFIYSILFICLATFCYINFKFNLKKEKYALILIYSKEHQSRYLITIFVIHWWICSKYFFLSISSREEFDTKDSKPVKCKCLSESINCSFYFTCEFLFLWRIISLRRNVSRRSFVCLYALC